MNESTLHRTSDPIFRWESELRATVIQDPSPEWVGTMTAAALGASLTTVAVAAATGGSTLMSTTITATAASSLAAKIAGIGVAATLAVGGSLAATGNLPDPAQEFSADAAARIGITLPRPGVETGVRGSLNAAVGTVIDANGAGHVAVDLDGGRLVILGVDAGAGFTAHVVAETASTVIVEFRSATETVTVLITNLGGTVTSSVTQNASGDAEVSGSVDGDADTEASLEGNGSTEAEAEVGVRIELTP
ncbi:MAG TPA: hypothetical protein VMM81_05795 [Acidimicrobiia bacterium]|nr:hypothetical protein [Acidimicrobiia bacterium]